MLRLRRPERSRRATLDAVHGAQRQRSFAFSRKAETHYAVQLRKVARQIRDIIQGFPLDDPSSATQIQQALERYSNILAPWARAVAGRMVEDVANRDLQSWEAMSRQMGQSLRRELMSAPTGDVMRQILDYQVELITSLPRQAAERVQKYAMEGLSESKRFSELAQEIMRTSDVSVSRANLIARTETARASSLLTQARAEHIGCDSYIWRSARDSDVRKSHRKMEGKVVRWDTPPILDKMEGHAGTFPNCRCYAEPVLPDFKD